MFSVAIHKTAAVEQIIKAQGPFVHSADFMAFWPVLNNNIYFGHPGNFPVVLL